MMYDAIVVGSGAAGLTAAAFLAKAGKSVLVCEKEPACGGLVNSFERDGFIYDGGIRALENSGVLFPMLRALGLDVEFVPNPITLGLEERVIRVDSEASLGEYQSLLNDKYPENKAEIAAIIAQMQKIMHYMNVQYGIDNPVFLDFKKDQAYMAREILPWMVKYVFTAPKIAALNEPVVDFLKHFTSSQHLLDIITQHFFRKTPAFFALSYLKLYLDYNYPRGGTGVFVKKLVSFIEAHGGKILNNTQINAVDAVKQTITDAQGNTHAYRRLIWAADLKTLYRILNLQNFADPKVGRAIQARQAEVSDKSGNDSVYTLFLGSNLPPEYFANIASGHFFYTPSRAGQSQAGEIPAAAAGREEIERWLQEFLALTTYEISIPVLRDATLAPPGKSGLVISVLFDYGLTKRIEQMGWYEEFKALCDSSILTTLDASIYPGIKDDIFHQFSSTPLTMEKLSGNAEGAITGWSFTNDSIPAESRIPKIMNAITTPIPGVYQAGQWTYSPSGLPISLITGKIAADRVIKELRS